MGFSYFWGLLLFHAFGTPLLKQLFCQLHTMPRMLRSFAKFWFFFCFGPTLR
jgi:hypothetical protein